MQLSAFINPWFIYYWIEASGKAQSPLSNLLTGFSLNLSLGYTWTFAAQCIICSFGLIPLYTLLQIYGVRMRSTRPMYAKYIDDMLEVPTAQGASNDADVALKPDCSDVV